MTYSGLYPGALDVVPMNAERVVGSTVPRPMQGEPDPMSRAAELTSAPLCGALSPTGERRCTRAAGHDEAAQAAVNAATHVHAPYGVIVVAWR